MQSRGQEAGTRMLETLTLSSFSGHVGTTFRLRLDAGGDVPLDLVEARGPRPAALRTARAGFREPFSLLFRGPMSPALSQKIHRLEHGQLGALEIFLVPVGPDGSGLCYEAVFN